MFANLSQSLEGGDSTLVGLVCMDIGKEQHEEQGGAEQEQGKEQGGKDGRKTTTYLHLQRLKKENIEKSVIRVSIFYHFMSLFTMEVINRGFIENLCPKIAFICKSKKN